MGYWLKHLHMASPHVSLCQLVWASSQHGGWDIQISKCPERTWQRASILMTSLRNHVARSPLYSICGGLHSNMLRFKKREHGALPFLRRNCHSHKGRRMCRMGDMAEVVWKTIGCERTSRFWVD